jgi:hypothetical protein
MIWSSCAMILLKMWDGFNSSRFFSWMIAFTKS